MSLRPQGSRRAEEKGPAKEEGANLERVERDRKRERENMIARAPRERQECLGWRSGQVI